MTESGLIPSLKMTLFEPAEEGLSELLAEICDAGLDAVLQNDALASFPFFGMVVAFCKTGINIRERWLIRQTALFIQAFNEGSISPEELQAYRKKLDEDPKKAEEELGRVMIYLDRMVEKRQVTVLGRFYAAYIKELITWSQFAELAETNSRMIYDDYDELRSIGDKPILQDETIPEMRRYKIRRLDSLGLLTEKREPTTEGTTLLLPSTDGEFRPSPLGLTFYTYMGSCFE